ncbi:MAG: hypothetical protein WCY34_06845, partial [Candidatus Omnitrophota bacterium]
GIVVVLGETGRNFAAGMSGGIAYVYDKKGAFSSRCNMSMVELGELSKHDELNLSRLLKNHYKYTASSLAKEILDNYPESLGGFIKILPIEYKNIMEKKASEKAVLSQVADG